MTKEKNKIAIILAKNRGKNFENRIAISGIFPAKDNVFAILN